MACREKTSILFSEDVRLKFLCFAFHVFFYAWRYNTLYVTTWRRTLKFTTCYYVRWRRNYICLLPPAFKNRPPLTR